MSEKSFTAAEIETKLNDYESIYNETKVYIENRLAALKNAIKSLDAEVIIKSVSAEQLNPVVISLRTAYAELENTFALYCRERNAFIANLKEEHKILHIAEKRDSFISLLISVAETSLNEADQAKVVPHLQSALENEAETISLKTIEILNSITGVQIENEGRGMIGLIVSHNNEIHIGSIRM